MNARDVLIAERDNHLAESERHRLAAEALNNALAVISGSQSAPIRNATARVTKPRSKSTEFLSPQDSGAENNALMIECVRSVVERMGEPRRAATSAEFTSRKAHYALSRGYPADVMWETSTTGQYSASIEDAFHADYELYNEFMLGDETACGLRRKILDMKKSRRRTLL
jgi:hypothetical protein